VREKNVLDMETAIQKMTSLPALRCGIYDRGILRPGMKADVVVFDPHTVSDCSRFSDPHHYAVGISWIFVNGRVAFENGETTGPAAGRLLRHRQEEC
jgi:N-acyl-D-aspartate/D-glutamate deacylase